MDRSWSRSAQDELRALLPDGPVAMEYSPAGDMILVDLFARVPEEGAPYGEAVHFDDFETRDLRNLRPGIGLTVEPGVYLPEFGVRIGPHHRSDA